MATFWPQVPRLVAGERPQCGHIPELYHKPALTSPRLAVRMAAVCSGSSIHYWEFMVKFHEENDLSGAFVRWQCALPRSWLRPSQSAVQAVVEPPN